VTTTEITAIVVFLGAALSCAVLYDRVLRLQYENDKRGWETEGRPPGFLWSPPDAGGHRLLRLVTTFIRWLFKPPPVARERSQIRTVYDLFRGACLVGAAAGGVLGLRLLVALF